MKIDKNIYKENKYSKWYYKLINSRILLNRDYNDGEFHKHHILPKSLGGENNNSNLVVLTPREHYICHLLLLEMTFGRNKSKMYCAFFRFNNEKHTTSRSYEFFLNQYSNCMKGENNPFYNKKHSDKTKKLIRENHGMKGKKHTKQSIIKMKKARVGQKPSLGLKHTDETIEKMKKARIGQKPALGMKHSAETKKQYSVERSGEKNNNFGKKRAWINNGNINKCVLQSELINYDNTIWKGGRV